ncbi:hypothetical protein C1646_767625 [Rhizophagus diaphanus]|nr:hypothetical protein C1646_767625 [Rhizophagus diaphanus] [Rhizophagus sp. MUCL 43196]
MHFVVKNEVRPFTLKISVILADLAETATFITTYLPSTSKRPCCFCLINNEDLSNMTLNNATVPDWMYMLDLGITKIDNFKEWLRKYLEVHCKRLPKYNKSDNFHYR